LFFPILIGLTKNAKMQALQGVAMVRTNGTQPKSNEEMRRIYAF
jgi:hypothetical protein